MGGGGSIHYDLICSNMTTEHRDFFFSEQKKVCILNFCAHTRLRDKRGSTTSQRKLSDTPINSLHQRQCARIDSLKCLGVGKWVGK